MNRLAQETSPYLLQHKDNPVDWFPWGEEALARARNEDKPILLSIGYSACHWCHVMEHESFENEEIARLMNENFVCIKVDREERPDLDHIYQNVAQAMTRSGGWPLTVFLTPELKPFYGGTYFPPEDRYGRPGFPRVLQALSQAYRSDRESVGENARRLTEFIAALEGGAAKGTARSMPTLEALEAAARDLTSAVDWQNGGLGGAPKFPNPMAFEFLWQLGFKDPVLLTLTKMAEGGIYDQLGGGFHRYSVDEFWSVPHFEKMLYDNALLLKLYSRVVLDGERDPLYLAVIRQTVDYVLREMTAADGAFYAAQDADSEGEEGKYFAWDLKDLAAALSPEEAQVFARHYGVDERGNFEHGKTVLYVADREGDPELLARARMKLLALRSKRVPPATDTKVLASWNGLMISALVWASRALGDPHILATARRAFDAVCARLGRESGKLYSTGKLNAYLDDYAFMARAALDLGLTDQAVVWIETVLKHFSGEEGYFFTSDDHEELIQRPKTLYDQAIPSGTGVVLRCLADLVVLGKDYSAELEKQLGAIFPQITRNPAGYGEILNASYAWLQGPACRDGICPPIKPPARRRE